MSVKLYDGTHAHFRYTLSLLVRLGTMTDSEAEAVHALLLNDFPAQTVDGVDAQIMGALAKVRAA